jgi:hypothetical protein
MNVIKWMGWHNHTLYPNIPAIITIAIAIAIAIAQDFNLAAVATYYRTED